ncbi:hypothetical protein, partial [Dickeya dianthicola]|uniref:hypothetical protein n=1 Tax=Dickeya dianthicola TaxID=204039 RepID=UPI001EE75597
STPCAHAQGFFFWGGICHIAKKKTPPLSPAEITSAEILTVRGKFCRQTSRQQVITGTTLAGERLDINSAVFGSNGELWPGKRI